MQAALEMMESRTFLSGSGMAGTLLSSESAASPQGSEFAVYAPHSTVRGKSLQQWSADWWSRMLTVRTPHNPLLDTTGADAARGDSGKVFFLAGVGFGSPTTVTRNITVPEGEPIFFPVLNAWADNAGIPPTNFTEAELRGFAAQLVGADTSPPGNVMHASVDNQPIADLLSHRELSPAFSYTMPATHNLYQDVFRLNITGTISGAVSDGYWIMLKPLSKGQHTIHFDGGVPGNNFALDVTYNIRVVADTNNQQEQQQIAQAQANPFARQGSLSALDEASHRRLVEQVLGS